MADTSTEIQNEYNQRVQALIAAVDAAGADLESSIARYYDLSRALMALDNIAQGAKLGLAAGADTLDQIGVGSQSAVRSALGLGNIATKNINGAIEGGALFEFGSNSNGRYFRTAEGFLICWGEPFELGDTSPLNWVFPYQFRYAPAVSATPSYSMQDRVYTAHAGGTTTTSTTIRVWVVTNPSSPVFTVTSTGAYAIAVGLWK